MFSRTKKDVEVEIENLTEHANREYLEFSGKNAYNVNNMNNKKKYYRLILVGVIFFIIGFVVSDILNKGGAGQGFMVDVNDNMIVDENNNENNEDITKTYSKKVSLETRDQLFGDSVLVFDVSLDKTSWIVIYEEIDGQLGNILGAGILDAGKILTYKVDLLRNTVGDSKYYIKIHPDNGDRIFNFKEDLPLKDVEYSFRTTSGRPN